MHKLIVTYEYSNLYPDEEKQLFSTDAILPKKSFDNLWNFILENTESELDSIMSVHAKCGHKYIKTHNYVGTVQTADGLIIEILPKIYGFSDSETQKPDEECRRVFLKMLSALQTDNAKSFQNANLEVRDNFPILEYYISNYLNEVEKLLSLGIKKNYSMIEANNSFLKGKLLVTKQVQINCLNKTKFFTRYSKYIEDIPQNRIIVSTLQRLAQSTHSLDNESHIHKLEAVLFQIPESTNINSDLAMSLNSNRTFASYELLLQWSSQFLKRKGFTTFSGSHFNQALLFPAEKLFESYIAMLFRKYAADFITSAQHAKYYLIDKHRNKGIFKLRPDLFLQSENSDKKNKPYDCILIDTKWKIINSKLIDKNYLIDIKDMYQLFAYGEKYGQGIEKEKHIQVIPKLILLYPCTKEFKKPLPVFNYEEIKHDTGLKLYVFPFDLSDPEPRQQVRDILLAVRP